MFKLLIAEHIYGYYLIKKRQYRSVKWGISIKLSEIVKLLLKISTRSESYTLLTVVKSLATETVLSGVIIHHKNHCQETTVKSKAG